MAWKTTAITSSSSTGPKNLCVTKRSMRSVELGRSFFAPRTAPAVTSSIQR